MSRKGIIIRCEECKNENYITKKNDKLHTDKFEVKKYCPNCDKHINHKEKK